MLVLSFAPLLILLLKKYPAWLNLFDDLFYIWLYLTTEYVVIHFSHMYSFVAKKLVCVGAKKFCFVLGFFYAESVSAACTQTCP